MKKSILVLMALALTIGFFGGCAGTTVLQKETAFYLVDMSPEEVVVSNAVWSDIAVKWEALTPKGRYACTADNMVREVECLQR